MSQAALNNGSRVVVEVPALSRVRLCRSCEELNGRISNDESYELAGLIEATTGTWIAMDKDTSAGAYTAVLEAARGLDISARVLSWLMDVHDPAENPHASPGTSLALGELAEDPAVRAAFQKVAHAIRDQLSDGARAHDGSELVKVRLRPRMTWSPGAYDFFISYKHMLHQSIALELTRVLRQLGFSCFLDVDDLPKEVAKETLHEALRAALDASRCCVFFETVAQATADQRISGHHTASSIHVFELHHAANVLFVRLDPPEIYSRRGPVRSGWRSPEELAQMLSAELGFSDGGPGGADPALPAVLDLARRRITDVLGTPVEVAPLAALAVAAPGQVDLFSSIDSPPFGDAVLKTLLCYDLESSLALEEAGIPPLAWAAATAARPQARWRSPLTHLSTGLPDKTVRLLRDRVEQTGLFDEAALAIMVLASAANPATYQGMALGRALEALPHGQDPVSDSKVAAVSARAIELLIRRPVAARHGWLRIESADESEIPVSRCGPYEVVMDGRRYGPLELFARQDLTLYPDALVAMHQTSLQDIIDGDVDELAQLTMLAPEIALTLEPQTRRLCVVDVSPDGDGSIYVAMSSGEGTDRDATDELRSVLPPQIARTVRSATVRALPVDKENVVQLSDPVALWDLIARACSHLAAHALDPALLPTSPGSVAPTSTYTTPQ